MIRVEVPVEDGKSIVVEMAERDLSPQQTALAATSPGVVVRASVSFEEALAGIQPVLQKAASSLSSMVSAPDEVELEFGIKLTADAGVIFTKVGGEANFAIKATWKKK